MDNENNKLVIDVHAHLLPDIKAWPKVFWESLYGVWVHRLGKQGAEKKRAELDGTVEKLISDMDDGGVDKAVISPVDFGLMCGQEPEISIWSLNQYIADSQKNYPDRLIGFVGVDALRDDATELLEKGVTEWGLKGVKIFPSLYKVTDERIKPFWDRVNELELPVLLHQGIDPLPYLMQYGNPLDLDVLTLRYPKMRIIGAHVARGFDGLLTEIITYRDKLYTDLSAKQPAYYASPWHFILELRYLMDKIPGKVLMGTDWPTNPIKDWFDVIRNLRIPEPLVQLELGIRDFSQEEKDMILGENAKQFLKGLS